MKLDCPTAFVPLMTNDVIIKINAGHVNADTLSIKACVRAGTPDGATVGQSGNCAQWTVVFREEDWKSPRIPSRGTIIEADKLNNQFPRLIVQHVYRLGGLITFECSANEKGVAR